MNDDDRVQTRADRSKALLAASDPRTLHQFVVDTYRVTAAFTAEDRTGFGVGVTSTPCVPFLRHTAGHTEFEDLFDPDSSPAFHRVRARESGSDVRRWTSIYLYN